MCEGWNKRLIVGIYLRKWEVPDDILARSKEYEDELEELEHMFQHRVSISDTTPSSCR
jgi:hypothetical protein